MIPRPDDTLMLMEVPPGMLDDLPPDEEQALCEGVGKPIMLKEYDDAGRAGLEFKDRNGDLHCIYLSSTFISPVK
jgi:hypothetical protein